ncbi:hypothetical protein FA95DRAFT_446391 [Auriscalpium vulgare]|uniref:Uncharacterized protein n=1 Tax=Auriscalpium vulgare TaxID=40419 RepID=A0ACB8RGK0_9AGAM|nr:hypothetical protein FA95DRAFT_446391 [Auriscalpium vulgare]
MSAHRISDRVLSAHYTPLRHIIMPKEHLPSIRLMFPHLFPLTRSFLEQSAHDANQASHQTCNAVDKSEQSAAGHNVLQVQRGDESTAAVTSTGESSPNLQRDSRVAAPPATYFAASIYPCPTTQGPADHVCQHQSQFCLRTVTYSSRLNSCLSRGATRAPQPSQFMSLLSTHRLPHSVIATPKTPSMVFSAAPAAQHAGTDAGPNTLWASRHRGKIANEIKVLCRCVGL